MRPEPLLDCSTARIGMRALHLDGAVAATVVALAAALWPASAVRAHGAASELSAISMLPVAVSVVAPVGLLSAGAVFTVVAVEAAADGTVWVLERASDGARASIRLGGQAVGGLSVVAGTAVGCSAFAAGWVLSAAGQVLAFIPNELGRALLYDERVTR